MIVLSLLLYVVSAFQCRPYECSYLTQGVCASVSMNSTIFLNKSGCPSNSQCDYLALYKWASHANANESFECHSSSINSWFFRVLDDIQAKTGMTLAESISIPENKVQDSFMECSKRDIKAQYPNSLQMCESDQDCVMLNGEVGSCSCGLDGNKYCNVGMHSEEFDAYWKLCEELGDKIDEDTAKLWYWYSLLYVQVKTNPDCSDDVLSDLANIEELSDLVTSANWLFLPVILILVA